MKSKVFSIMKLVARVIFISLLPASLMWLNILYYGDSPLEIWEMWDATFYAIENFGEERIITVVVLVALFFGLVVTLAVWRAYYAAKDLFECLPGAYRKMYQHLRAIIANRGDAK